jgi:RimJ/RimL family protein N-acetyltransferase
VNLDSAVTCRRDGLHVATSPRLWIVTNRLFDLARYSELAREPEAQRWLGWRPEDFIPLRPGMMAWPIWQPQPMVPPEMSIMLFAGIHRVTNVMVGAVSIDRSGGRADVGGVVAGDHRGQGFGTEILRAACTVAHRHFGIPRLTAGCEAANVASRRWLTRSGFNAVPGPPTHTLPDGRVIESVWWDSVDADAALTCRQLLPKPSLLSRLVSRTSGR